jgi:tripartite-type tricarboxylate transporter receptor subunit TctC
MNTPRLTRRQGSRALALALASLLLPIGAVQAQGSAAWPTKPIRLVIPFTAGGAQDTAARVINADLGDALGQNVLIENRGGAGGTLATSQVARAAPDGYTMIVAAASHNINASLYRKLDYDAVADFAPVAVIGLSSYVIIGRGDAPYSTLGELIAWGRANPGKLNYSTSGVGSAGHLSAAYLFGLTGVDAVAIPTKGMGEAMTEVVAGRADLMVATNNVALPFVNDRRIRILAVTSAAPNRFVPGVPAAAATVPGFTFETWFGILAPAKTPRAVIDRVNTEMARLLRRPDVIERLNKQGIEPRILNPEEFATYLRSDFERMATVVKMAGAKAEE